ncbi:hypothetical protein SDC9_168796 [bioreactor metagenome]|uniref:Uncharacterized protein n=1 Tax=bioreactor metagenome TaxID=1076179 RepID=A0A645G3F0_9ZZZZ
MLKQHIGRDDFYAGFTDGWFDASFFSQGFLVDAERLGNGCTGDVGIQNPD